MRWRKSTFERYAGLRWKRTDPGNYETRARITVAHGKTQKLRTENVVVKVWSVEPEVGREVWSAEIKTVAGFEVGTWHSSFRTKREAAASMWTMTKVMWVQMRYDLVPLSQGNLMSRFERGEEIW